MSQAATTTTRTSSGTPPVSQSVSYFTVPPRAQPSTGSQSGSAQTATNEPTSDDTGPAVRNSHDTLFFGVADVHLAGPARVVWFGLRRGFILGVEVFKFKF